MRTVEQVYEEVAARPDARRAELVELVVGAYWVAVRTSLGTGLASSMSREHEPGSGRPVSGAGGLQRRTPLELAALIGSRSAPEAAIGLATVNALSGPTAGRHDERNAAELLCERGRDRLVALIGRFPFVDRLRAACRELWVFERGPRRRPDDLGEEHMPELVPHAEVVAITATTLLNGTLDGLVELLDPAAFVAMIGPSTPFATALFARGFDVLCGTVVEDGPAVVRAVGQGAVTSQIVGVRRICAWRHGSQG